VQSSYPTDTPTATMPKRNFLEEFEEAARAKVSELLQTYLEQEADALLQRARYQRREAGMPAAYRDGHDEPRPFTTSSGTLTIARPRIRGVAHESTIVPPYQRRAASLDKAMHALWIEGLATRDVEPALRALLGEQAPLSAATVTRTNEKFFGDYEDWSKRSLADVEFVYLWLDGIFLGAGPDDERRVILTILGADTNGTKHLLALRDAMSESEISWGELFEDMKARGFQQPRLLIADGANGIWAAAEKAFPDARQQRCWFHKIKNVLDKVPASKTDEVKTALNEAMYSETKELCESRMKDLAAYLDAAYPRAAACVSYDVDRLVSFFAFPEGNWKSIRTNNPLESVFSSVRLRTDAAKRMRTGASATYLVFALIKRLSANWNRISGHKHIAAFIAATGGVAA
jgi:putative transposase